MGLINTVGYYKGTITSNALVKSSGGLPEEDLVLLAEEVYDGETGEWLPADSEAAEITGYFQLKGHKKNELSASKQLVKITDWDGQDLLELLEMDLTGVPMQWRVEENEYNGNTSLKVTWIDPVGATPGRSVTPVSVDEVKAMAADFGYRTTAKAASAKKKVVKKTSKKPTPKPPTPPKTAAVVGKCTDQEAYTECFTLSGSEGGDELEKALEKVWREEVVEVNVDEAKITDEEWFEIKGRVAKRTNTVG